MRFRSPLYVRRHQKPVRGDSRQHGGRQADTMNPKRYSLFPIHRLQFISEGQPLSHSKGDNPGTNIFPVLRPMTIKVWVSETSTFAKKEYLLTVFLALLSELVLLRRSRLMDMPPLLKIFIQYSRAG
jgi:hypothetical protein